MSLSNGRKTEDQCSAASFNQEYWNNKVQKLLSNNKISVSRSKERHVSIENHTSIRKIMNHSSIQSHNNIFSNLSA